MDWENLSSNPTFRQAAFIFAVLLLLSAWSGHLKSMLD